MARTLHERQHQDWRGPMLDLITESDCRTLGRYRDAGLGAWATMPEEDRAAYRRVNHRLEAIAAYTLAQNHLNGVVGCADGLGEAWRSRGTAIPRI